ncbi:MAG TPA: hypothetical protein VFQ60_03705, partial [Patescibacteria group bacterium]|nr:hypothetical protein [Patescibacteria group bacterium]
MTNGTFQGRAFEPLPVGSRVLIITCPVLAYEFFGSSLTKLSPVNLTRVLDGAQRNQFHGVQSGIL